MIIPSGGCDAMHMAAEFEVLRRDLRIAEEYLGLARGERDALAKRVVRLEQEKAVLIDFAKKSCEACEICRHVDIMASEKCEGDCDECAFASCCICAMCCGASEFEFAGVGEGNGL